MNNYFIDKSKFVDIVYKNSNLLYEKKSKYQNIKVFKNDLYGKILVINDVLKLTDFDEHNYHEMISHIPLNYNPDIKNVLIIGGGDGGTAREILKHNSIINIDQVEIDIEVINICKKFFPELSISYEDPRLNLIIESGLKWIEKKLNSSENKYDLIIIDSNDHNTALELFTKDFYQKTKDLLSKYGILIFNFMSLSLEVKILKETQDKLSTIFKYTKPYQVFQPSNASGHYSFMFCSNKIDPTNYAINWSEWDKKELSCKYYNKEIHYSAFCLPNFAKNCDQKLVRLGTHFLIDAEGCNLDQLNNVNYLLKMCYFIAEFYELTVVDHIIKKFANKAVSIVLLLSESHMSIHCWPEIGKFSFDLFSCSCFKFNLIKNKIKINIKTIIKCYLKPKNINFKSIEREI